MLVTIKFETSNASFEDNLDWEVKDILDQAKQCIYLKRELYHPLRDSNGNEAGSVSVKEQSKMPKVRQCECSDPGCPCESRRCIGQRTLIYRVDMEDLTGTLMCRLCCDDAMETGLFTEDNPNR